MFRSAVLGAGVAVTVGAAAFFVTDGASPRASRPVVSARAEAAPAEVVAPADPSVRVVWPTPYPRLTLPLSDTGYLQPTVSGNPASGGFGMVRDGGARFHEGLDIRPVARDRRGEPADDVLAAMDGRIAYVNPRANGAYGKYVVLEHSPAPGLLLYTLYAHLAEPDPRVRAGLAVRAGTRLGLMGRTDAKGGFPRDRAHLHFEIGLRLSNNFARWYAGRRFPDPNLHGDFNGLNLAGLDPAEFFRFVLENGGAPKASAITRWVRERPVSVVVETPGGARTPNFLTRNAALATARPAPAVGWRIGFTAYGAPVSWQPLALAPPSARVTLVDGPLAADARRRGLITAAKRGGRAPGSTLETAPELACE